MVAKVRLGVLAALLPLAACTPDDFKGVEIRYMAWGNPQQLALEKKFCEDFTKEHPGIRVKFIQTPSTAYHLKMVLMLASRTAPDVMRVDHYDFPSLVAKDYFHPLDDLIKNDPTYRLSDYFPGAVEEGQYKGGMYGLSVLFGAPIIYYNKDLLAKAHLEEPYNLWKRGEWTWDAYLRYAQAMTTKDKEGKPLTFGSWINGLPFQAAVAYSFGGAIMKDGRVDYASGPQLESLRFLHDLRFKYKVEPNASQAANSMFSFDGGKTGMQIEWMGITPRLRDTAKFDWDVCPTPIKPGGTTMVKGNQLVMSIDSQHPQEAWEFMKFMTGKRAEEKLYVDLRRCFPTRKDVAYSPEYLASGDKPPHHMDAFIFSVEKGRVLPITSRWSEWTTEFNGALEPLFNGTTHDVDKTVVEAQRRANETLAVREGL
jgi:multiple sugar transport system substrate-binding protein